MKQFFLLLLFPTIVFVACGDEKKQFPTCENCEFTCLTVDDTNVYTNACQDNWTCEYKLATNSRVDVDEYGGISEGDKTTFQLIVSTEGDEAIADDEFTYFLVFEVDNSLSSFSAENAQLSALNLHYKRICFCPDAGVFQAITAGCLQGKQQEDGSWFVQGKIAIPSVSEETDLQFEAQFVRE
ncbi:MAG: hypothetical protein D6772_03240 [Bacteroidetes bacterium]|nr:MAG: hypothetical protein D6772_03240 [Bacteroidota bacterium]